MCSNSPSSSSHPWKFTFLLLILLQISLTSSFCPPLCVCNDSSLSVDCSGSRNLRMVPIFLNPRTKFLSLSANQITDISMSFQFYSDLQLLDFSSNKISELGSNNFENLRNTRILNASFNGIHGLESDVFLGLSAVQVLDLRANQLEKITPGAFRSLPSLRELHLDRNRLDTLDWSLFQSLESLEILSVKYNFLRVVQPPTTTPTTTGFSLKKIRNLDMSWNQITRIKDGGLNVFPDLRDLNLCCNYIHTVEELAFVPQSPKGQSGILKVNLSQNRMTRIPTAALEPLRAIEELDLSSNRIFEKLPPHSFRNLFQLRILRLNDNPGIGGLDPDALVDNVNLVEFQADHLSNLTELPAGIFNNKPFLREFSIRFAAVAVIPEELLSRPQYAAVLPALRLVGNPLDCNCSALPVYQYISAPHPAPNFKPQNSNSRQTNTSGVEVDDLPHSHSLGQVQCASPPHLAGAAIQDLRRVDFEHCFEPVFFGAGQFEILVIAIAAVIVVGIITLIVVKLCCAGPGQRCSKCRSCRCCRCPCIGGKDEKENSKGLDDLCCSNGGIRSTGTLTRERTEYPTIVAAKKVLNVSSEEFRAAGGRGRSNGGFGPMTMMTYSNANGNGYNKNGSNSHSGGPHSLTSTSGPLTLTTSGSPSPMELDGYLHHYPSRSATVKSNKLRFDPKMHLQMTQLMMEDGKFTPPSSPYHHHSPHSHGHHPPLILHYEYDYPDYRSNQRVKQVPSVLV